MGRLPPSFSIAHASGVVHLPARGPAHHLISRDGIPRLVF